MKGTLILFLYKSAVQTAKDSLRVFRQFSRKELAILMFSDVREIFFPSLYHKNNAVK